MSKYTGPKSFSDEIRRLPIDQQRHIRYTLVIGAAWAGAVLVGAGVFLLSKPFIDRRRKEKMETGEFFGEIKDKENSFPRQRIYSKQNFPNPHGRSVAVPDLSPPPYLLGVLDQIKLNEEDDKGASQTVTS